MVVRITVTVVFTISDTLLKKVVVWDRKEEKGFPELKELVNHKA